MGDFVAAAGLQLRVHPVVHDNDAWADMKKPAIPVR
jgi:hypothetical protein